MGEGTMRAVAGAVPRGFAAALAAILLCGCASSGSRPTNAPVRLVVDTAATRQTMVCFGASGAWSLDHIGSEWSEEGKRRLAELLFSTESGMACPG
jgi:hypothetical protein